MGRNGQGKQQANETKKKKNVIDFDANTCERRTGRKKKMNDKRNRIEMASIQFILPRSLSPPPHLCLCVRTGLIVGSSLFLFLISNTFNGSGSRQTLQQQQRNVAWRVFSISFIVCLSIKKKRKIYSFLRRSRARSGDDGE